MIIKPLKPTLELLQTEALNRRLSLHHPEKEKVMIQARNLRAGYNGENAIQYPLNFLPQEKYLIFFTLRLDDSQGNFQIDTLLLSTSFILIIEVKNIRGNMFFDDLGQAYRTVGESSQGFINPVDQVKLQHLRLQRWLKQFDFPKLPIEKIAVFASPDTVLKNLTNSKELPKIVMHKEKIFEKVEELSRKYPRESLTEDQLTDLAFQILINHEEKPSDAMNKYNIKEENLVKGVICPICFAVPMRRKAGKWLCVACGSVDRDAHRTAFADYALLINKYINNREAKKFLHLESSNITKHLIQNERWEQFGVNSGRRYKIDLDTLI